MLSRDERQLIDLLNEKISHLLHEVAELKRENRRLTKTVREMEKRSNAENSGRERTA